MKSLRVTIYTNYLELNTHSPAYTPNLLCVPFTSQRVHAIHSDVNSCFEYVRVIYIN